MTRERRRDWEASQPDEHIHIDVPLEYRDINAEEVDMPIEQLWSWYMSGTIHLEPEFQREYVWDQTRASRFIESLMLGLPIPGIFLSENRDGTWDVVDGHQRLETLFQFLQPLSAGPAKRAAVKPRFKSLILRDLEVVTEMNGQDIESLDIDTRRRLLERKIPVIRIPASAHEDLKFVLFVRLNLGSMALNPQELRNCIYRGSYNNMIRELAESADVLAFLGRSEPHKRMDDREKVLRFFALAHRRARYRTPFRMFLNSEMSENRQASHDQLSTYKAEFLNALKWTQDVFGDTACRLFRIGTTDANPNGYWDRRMDLVYDVEMIGFHEFGLQLKSVLRRGDSGLDSLRWTLVGVMAREDFLRTLREGTTGPAGLRQRHELWNQAIARFVHDPGAVMNRFSALLDSLRRSNICAICPQPIGSPYDADLTGTGSIVHRICARHDRQQRLADALQG